MSGATLSCWRSKQDSSAQLLLIFGAIQARLLGKPSPPLRLAGSNPHRSEATRSRRALCQGPRSHTHVGARASLQTPKSGTLLGKGARRERRRTIITSPGHVPPLRGHRDAATRLVTSRAGPCRAFPCPGAGMG